MAFSNIDPDEIPWNTKEYTVDESQIKPLKTTAFHGTLLRVDLGHWPQAFKIYVYIKEQC